MSKLFRAVLISAVATGTAVVLMNVIQRRNSSSHADDAGKDRFVDAEQLSEKEQSLLTDELDAML